MGIQLLTAFVNNELPKVKESLSSIVQRHDVQNPGKKLKILFDGFALFFHLFESRNLHKYPLCWLNGGDYLVIGSRIAQYLRAWVKFKQVKLVIIFDGCQEEKKQATTTKRKQAYIDLNRYMFTYHQRPTKQDGGNGPNNMRTSTLPPFVKQAFLSAVQSFSQGDQIEVIQAPFEADFLLAKYACEEQCYVVTNDSDFFIFPTAGCITLRDIEFRDNMEIWLACTTNQMLADRLRLSSVQLLNGLACLSKNDYNTGKGIEKFHAHLDTVYPGYHQMEQIAKYINEHLSRDETIPLKDRLFQLFTRAIMTKEGNDPNQQLLLDVTKQIYDDFDVEKLDDKSKFFDYDWIIEECEKNRERRPDVIRSYKNLSIDSDLVDLTTNRVINLNILIEDPGLKGANQLWTTIRKRIFAYHFFHVSSVWNRYVTPDEERETVSIEEGLIKDGTYVIDTNVIDSELYNQVFPTITTTTTTTTTTTSTSTTDSAGDTGSDPTIVTTTMATTTEQNDNNEQKQDDSKATTNLDIFASIWKLGNSESALLVSALSKIDRILWPIVCVYLALKMEILPQESRLKVYDWELESIFASFFQIDANEQSQILELTSLSYEPKRHTPSFRTNDWTSSTFHELVALMQAGVRMFELCNASINFLIPIHHFRSAILLYNGSLQKIMYERARHQQGNLWFVDEEHHSRYMHVKKSIAEIDTVQLPKQDFQSHPAVSTRAHSYYQPRYAPYASHHHHHQQHQHQQHQQGGHHPHSRSPHHHHYHQQHQQQQHQHQPYQHSYGGHPSQQHQHQYSQQPYQRPSPSQQQHYRHHPQQQQFSPQQQQSPSRSPASHYHQQQQQQRYSHQPNQYHHQPQQHLYHPYPPHNQQPPPQYNHPPRQNRRHNSPSSQPRNSPPYHPTPPRQNNESKNNNQDQST